MLGVGPAIIRKIGLVWGGSMTITRQADYAVRAVLYLCQHGPTARIVTSEIGREQHIPVTFLAKIIAQLSAAGVVRSTRGAHGGAHGRPDVLGIVLGMVRLRPVHGDRLLGPPEHPACAVQDPGAGAACADIHRADDSAVQDAASLAPVAADAATARL